MLKSIIKFFGYEPTVYSHRNRTIEEVASEKGIDIDSIKDETRLTIKNKGRVEAVTSLTHQFHLPLHTAWAFVDDLDQTSRDDDQ